jgi:hypothetical protein
MNPNILSNNRPRVHEYRPIPGFPNHFVREDGRVRGLRGRPLRGWLTKDGYRQFSIEGKKLYAHRLVMLAFAGPPPFPDAVVDHRDFDKLNNYHANLRWLSRHDNIRHTPSNPIL